MAILVKKFGGTSIANVKLIQNAALKIKNEINKGNKVICVISAMGDSTNKLLSIANKLNKKVENKPEIDSIVSTGEQISASLLAMALQNLNINARSYLGWQLGLKTNDNFGEAEIIGIDDSKLKEIITSEVAIIAGFQGVTSDNRITTLGRGASDYTASFIAGALKADRCDIYTDVDGVYSADPKLITSAIKYNYISYDEMYAMACLGSKVVHKSAILEAKKHNITLRILSSFSPNQPATIISDKSCNRKICAITHKESGSKTIISIVAKEENLAIISDNINKYLDQNAIDSTNITSSAICLEINSNIAKDFIKLIHDKFEKEILL